MPLSKRHGTGIKPTVYTHSIGAYVHNAGPIFGFWDKQEGVPIRGDLPVNEDTCYSIELNIQKNVPEWGGAEVRMLLEEEALYTEGKLEYISGRQTKLIVI